MKTIKILGTGCAKCKQTEAIIKEVIAKEGIEANVIKVEDIQDIMAYNILSTPAVVVDEVVKIKGKVPSAQEILAALS
jgi:small redox-active disulfide protein 2